MALGEEDRVPGDSERFLVNEWLFNGDLDDHLFPVSNIKWLQGRV